MLQDGEPAWGFSPDVVREFGGWSSDRGTAMVIGRGSA